MPEARTFTHHEPGTGEPAWLLDARWDAVPRLGLDRLLRRYPHVALIAPHPDDETLSLGATLVDLAEMVQTVTVVMVTQGDRRSGSPRRTEGERAVATLGAHIETVWWDFPDGSLDDAVVEMVGRLRDIVDGHTLLLAPVECDGHADHEAVAAAAEIVARERAAALLCYPVWLWHWATPEDVDFSRLRTLAPSLRALTAKAQALDCYVSQLTSTDGSPIVGRAMRARARRAIETVLVPLPSELAARVGQDMAQNRRQSDIAPSFDAMLAGGVVDPWRLDESVYERRRLALTLACLGRPRYHSALEIGCSTGQLAEQLRARADEVVGLDASDQALEVARNRTDAVRWVTGAAPADIPAREFDLIVLSEVAYFLDGPELYATLRAVRRALRPHGEILIATYRAPTENIPLDGSTVHEQAAAVLDLPVRACYRDADLMIQVWGEPVSVHREYGDGA